MSDAAYRRLLGAFVAFYAENLCTPHWGEMAKLLPGNRLEIAMNFQGLDKAQATAIWQPFLDWVGGGGWYHRNAADDHRRAGAASLGRRRPRGRCARHVLHDDRPGAPAANFFWSANLAEAGHFIHGFDSLWLPATLLQAGRGRRHSPTH